MHRFVHCYLTTLLALMFSVCATSQEGSDPLAQETPVWKLTYVVDIKTQHSETTQGPARQTKESLELTVWLAADRFATSSGQGVSAYDFATETIATEIPDEHVQHVYPLFANVAFRVAEMQNVLWIDGGLLAAGLDKEEDSTGTRDLRDIETRFGLLWPHKVEDIPLGTIDISQPEAGVWQLHHNHQPEARAELAADSPVFPEFLRDTYARFLLYSCPMHPDLWDALATAGQPLRLLELNTRDTFKARHTVYRLKETETNSVWPKAFAQLPVRRPINLPEVEDATAFSVWVQRIADNQDLPPRPTLKQVLATAEDAVARGCPFDAFLALIGHTLQEGVLLDDEIGAIVSEHAKDPQLAAYLSAIRGPHPESEPTGFDRLLEIDRTGLTHAHVLDIFTANEATAAGNREATYIHFARALDVNPHITGVWHDLGSLSFADYDTFTAWQCIETARKLQPDHPMLEQIAGFEHRVRADFPRFFKKP